MSVVVSVVGPVGLVVVAVSSVTVGCFHVLHNHPLEFFLADVFPILW